MIDLRKLRDIFTRIRRRRGRAIYFSQIMPLKDASRLVRGEKSDQEIQFHLSASNRNVSIRGATSDITCLEKVFFAKEYDTPFPTDPEVIVDAGANIGLATLFFAQKYPKARIFSIEPERSNFEMLKKNCADLPNVTLFKGALWDKEAVLSIKDGNAEKWEFSVTESSPTSPSKPQEVQAVTIPKIMHMLGVNHIDILKLDIEGGEYGLFKNEAELWLQSVGQIIIELHDRFRPGCAHAFYAAVSRRYFVEEIRGENIFIKLEDNSERLRHHLHE
jgi:FkbM family methyltransferase